MLVRILLKEPAAGLAPGEALVDEQVARGWAAKGVCEILPEEGQEKKASKRKRGEAIPEKE